MTSITSRTRQNSPSHFMSISSIVGCVYAYNATEGANTFTNATWATNGSIPENLTNTLVNPGVLLKDIGKNVISSNRYFRKVQLVVPNGPKTNYQSTYGVAGPQGTSPNQDYFTGYIELGYEGGGLLAPVVQFCTI